MSDHLKCTPPIQTSIRETLLWRFENPDDAEAVRRLGALLTELVDESGQWGPKNSTCSSIAGEFQAVVDDLGHLVAYLERMAAAPESSEVVGADLDLCRAADCWAGRLARVVVDMRHRLGP